MYVSIYLSICSTHSLTLDFDPTCWSSFWHSSPACSALHPTPDRDLIISERKVTSTDYSDRPSVHKVDMRVHRAVTLPVTKLIVK